jgi:hypothetical protein
MRGLVHCIGDRAAVAFSRSAFVFCGNVFAAYEFAFGILEYWRLTLSPAKFPAFGEIDFERVLVFIVEQNLIVCDYAQCIVAEFALYGLEETIASMVGRLLFELVSLNEDNA